MYALTKSTSRARPICAPDRRLAENAGIPMPGYIARIPSRSVATAAHQMRRSAPDRMLERRSYEELAGVLAMN